MKYPAINLCMLLILIVGGNALAENGTSKGIVTSHGIAMHGALKYPKTFSHFDYVNPEAPKGGAVTLSAYGTFDSLNPDIVKGDALASVNLIYDTLMEQSKDEPFSMYGLVAEKVEYPEDRSWVIFHINPKARFHDGHPITAEDVVFTYNRLIEDGAPFYKAYYADVVKVEALDKSRVKFTARDSKNRELILILGQLKVLPKHFWEERDFSEALTDIPLGSGPYQLSAIDPGKTAIFKRVEDYWAEDLAVRKGSYNFGKITFNYYRDETVMLEAFKGGHYDYREENSSKRWATEYQGAAFKNGDIIKQEIEHSIPTGMQAFVMNTRRPLFSNPKVRHALDYAFDFEWTNKQLFYGAYKRTNSYFSNSEMAATGLPSKDELALLEPFKDDLPKEVFTEIYQSPTTDGSGHNRANIRKAIALLKSAGWVFEGTKLVHGETGKPFEFEILLYSKDFERVVLPYVKNLKKLGIEANARLVDTTNYIRIVRNFDFDMIIGSFGQSNSPGNEQRDYWYSQFADHKGSRNIIGVKDPIVDQLVEKVIAAQTRDELVAACRALDRVLLWSHYVVPQFHIGKHRIAYWDKFAHPEIAPKYSDVGFYTWWIKPEKRDQ